MGWQRPGGCVGQKTIDDFVRVTWHCRGNGSSGVVPLCTADELHNLLLLSGIQLSVDLEVSLEPLVVISSAHLMHLMNGITVPRLGNVAPDGEHLYWGVFLQDRDNGIMVVPGSHCHSRAYVTGHELCPEVPCKAGGIDIPHILAGHCPGSQHRSGHLQLAGDGIVIRHTPGQHFHILQQCITLVRDDKIQDVSISVSGLGDVLCHVCRLQQVSKSSHVLIIRVIKVQVEITHKSVSGLAASIAQSTWPLCLQGTASL